MIGHSSASSVSVMEWSQGLVMSHVFFKCFAMCFSHPLDSCVFPVCAALCCLVLLLIIKLLQYIWLFFSALIGPVLLSAHRVFLIANLVLLCSRSCACQPVCPPNLRLDCPTSKTISNWPSSGLFHIKRLIIPCVFYLKGGGVAAQSDSITILI